MSPVPHALEPLIGLRSPAVRPSGPTRRIMDSTTRRSLDDLRTDDRRLHDAAFTHLAAATAAPVEWAYEAWDELIELLSSPSNRVRAISSQLLCRLAKSDPAARILEDLDRLIDVTRDERFVTARHCMQSLWMVGVAGEVQRSALLTALDRRFAECVTEKNVTLIRYDIMEALRRVYDQTGDESIRERALAWIETEADPKYRAKYSKVWKRSLRG